jgi:hypothetical protein
MSANADALNAHEILGGAARQRTRPPSAVRRANDWDPEDFAREQIRGLVRRVFFGGEDRPVKQVIFSAAEPQTDVSRICDQVGQALALEARSDVAIVSHCAAAELVVHGLSPQAPGAPIKSFSTPLMVNLWRVPERLLRERVGQPGDTLNWLSCLAALRNEFEYAVIHGAPVGVSSEAALLGHLADGIILVLGADSTRRATASKIKETLQGTHARLLGTVLSDRKFPVPERIYRRL